MSNHDRLERMAWRRSKRSVDRRLARWLSADAPKPKRSLANAACWPTMWGLVALLIALLMRWVLG